MLSYYIYSSKEEFKCKTYFLGCATGSNIHIENIVVRSSPVNSQNLI